METGPGWVAKTPDAAELSVWRDEDDVGAAASAMSGGVVARERRKESVMQRLKGPLHPSGLLGERPGSPETRLFGRPRVGIR